MHSEGTFDSFKAIFLAKRNVLQHGNGCCWKKVPIYSSATDGVY